jgi:hypothetical protein
VDTFGSRIVHYSNSYYFCSSSMLSKFSLPFASWKESRRRSMRQLIAVPLLVCLHQRTHGNSSWDHQRDFRCFRPAVRRRAATTTSAKKRNDPRRKHPPKQRNQAQDPPQCLP